MKFPRKLFQVGRFSVFENTSKRRFGGFQTPIEVQPAYRIRYLGPVFVGWRPS